MSRLSTFIHSHASVFKMGTEVLGLAISELPIPEVAKLPLMGVLVEMNKTANNMGDNANAVASNLLSELSGGVADTHSTNPRVQEGLQLVGQLSSSAAAILSATGGKPQDNVTVPNAPDAPPPSTAPASIVTAPKFSTVAGDAGAAPDQVAPVNPASVATTPPPQSVTSPTGMAPSQPGATDAPLTPVPATPSDVPPQQLAPATQVALGLAVDPNSAHVNSDGTLSAAPPPTDVHPATNADGSPIASPAPSPQPDDVTSPPAPTATDVAPVDPGLAVVSGSPELDAAEKEMDAAITSGDRDRIANAAQALADAARSAAPSPQ